MGRIIGWWGNESELVASFEHVVGTVRAFSSLTRWEGTYYLQKLATKAVLTARPDAVIPLPPLPLQVSPRPSSPSRLGSLASRNRRSPLSCRLGKFLPRVVVRPGVDAADVGTSTEPIPMKACSAGSTETQLSQSVLAYGLEGAAFTLATSSSSKWSGSPRWAALCCCFSSRSHELVPLSVDPRSTSAS